MDIPEIDVTEARALFEGGEAMFVDIRDPVSFEDGHIPGALHLDESNVRQFVTGTDRQATVVVYCYKGNASIGATAFFRDQGFSRAASLAGGFAAWHDCGGDTEAGAPGG
jgi:thiosulfate sulfurtransferase